MDSAYYSDNSLPLSINVCVSETLWRRVIFILLVACLLEVACAVFLHSTDESEYVIWKDMEESSCRQILRYNSAICLERLRKITKKYQDLLVACFMPICYARFTLQPRSRRRRAPPKRQLAFQRATRVCKSKDRRSFRKHRCENLKSFSEYRVTAWASLRGKVVPVLN
jgi:hypothetical protein